jgi:hypothetical protein
MKTATDGSNRAIRQTRGPRPPLRHSDRFRICSSRGNPMSCLVPPVQTRSRRSPAPVLAVPEIGHAAPAYGLSTHGDTWQDVLAVTCDLRFIWAGQAG